MAYKNVPLSRYIRRKLKRLRNFAALATRFNLTVGIKQRLRNQLILMDSVRKKLLFIKREKNNFDCSVIDLRDVKHCSVKKDYGSIRAGELEKKGLGHYLKSISLQLGFKNGGDPLSVNFYESDFHNLTQLNYLEATARKWEACLSEQIKKTAA